MTRMIRTVVAMSAMLPAVFFAGPSADAATVTITSKGSSIDLDPTLQTGVANWTIDGVDQLSQLNFWFRVGLDPEASVDTLASTVTTSKVNFSPTDNRATVVWTNPGQFRLTYRTTLTGQPFGGHAATVADLITIENLSGDTLDFTLFQFMDLQLGGTVLGDTIEAVGSLLNIMSVTDGLSIFQNIVTPTPTAFQIDTAAALLALLNDGLPTTLTNNVGPVGPDDTAFALQWDFTIGAGQSVVISQTRAMNVDNAIPEPGSAALLGLAAGAAGLFRRRG